MIYIPYNIKTIDVLGVDFDVDLTNICKINYDKKISKIKSIITQWNKRDLRSNLHN